MSGDAQVLIVGAGPAGASLACVLARRGVRVVLLERQRDFSREFRGEVLLPNGVDALQQMGFAAALAATPHATFESVAIYANRRTLAEVALDSALFDGRDPMAVSQPALLEAIVAEAVKQPSFRFVRGATVRDLLREGDRVTGVRFDTSEGERRFSADLVVGCDGRSSIVRRKGGLHASEQAPPMDIVWCKLPGLPSLLRGARAYLGGGHLLIAYGTYGGQLQVAWAILKGTFGDLRRRGIPQWIEEMAGHVSDDLAAHLRAHAGAAAHPFLLDAVSDRVLTWSLPGALVLGDAAHTMSPVGGQGLNMALRDAIVAANHLVPALAEGSAEALDDAAQQIERERTTEIVAVQRLQALPPRIVLARAFWGEPVRRALAVLLASGPGRALVAHQIRPFLFGTHPLHLDV